MTEPTSAPREGMAAVTLWEKMGKASGGGGSPEFLSTHPSAETRTADLRDYSARVLPLLRRFIQYPNPGSELETSSRCSP